MVVLRGFRFFCTALFLEQESHRHAGMSGYWYIPMCLHMHGSNIEFFFMMSVFRFGSTT